MTEEDEIEEAEQESEEQEIEEAEQDEQEIQGNFIDESDEFAAEPELAGTGQFVAPVLEQDESAFQTLEQTAEEAPSTAQQTDQADDFSYDSASGESKSYSSDFSEYESAQKRKYAAEEQTRRTSSRDLTFDEGAAREDIISPFTGSAAARALQNIQAPTSSQQQMTRGEFQEQQARYQEQLREESGPAFRRRKIRESRIR